MAKEKQEAELEGQVPGTALAPITPGSGRSIVDPTAGASPVWCSWPINNDAGKKALIKCLSHADTPMDEMLDKPFYVENVLTHLVGIHDKESGEVVECVRTVLVNPEGHTVGCCSEGVLSSLRMIFALYRKPPWKPPLQLVCHRVKTRGGFHTYNLFVV